MALSPRSIRSRRLKAGLTAGLTAGVLLAVSACSSGGGTAPPDGGGGGEGGEVVIFIPSSSNNYINAMLSTSTPLFEGAGYTVKVFENNFDQTEQDQQVQQYLATGDKPAGIIWFPADNQAGIASVRRLAALEVPIVQTNQAVLPEAEDYVTAYAGEDDYANGVTSGESALEWRDAWAAAGKTLHSDAGNVLTVSYPAGYQAGEDRIAGFDEGTASAPFDIVDTLDVGFTTESSFTATQTAWPNLASQGIDLIYGVSQFPLVGAIQAAEESGLVAGQDFGAISGNCQTDFDLFIDGSIFATAIQSPNLEGTTFANVLIRLIENGGETQGPGTTESLPADPDAVPDLSEVPAYATFMPNPPMIGGGTPEENQKVVDEAMLWGSSAEELCAK